MEMTPHRYARYRNERGHIWDTRHYEDDFKAFEDERGALWTRTVVTIGLYRSADGAKDELIRLEREK